MVGETGFEPATLCSQSRCATRLRYSPKRDPKDLAWIRVQFKTEDQLQRKLIPGELHGGMVRLWTV